MIGYILLLISSLLKWILTPILYSYGIVVAIFKGEFSEYNKNLAIAKDQYGNALGKYLFNQLLIKKEGYKFGNIDETISSVIGKNKLKSTLTMVGKIIDKILNSIEKDHSIKSIDETIK